MLCSLVMVCLINTVNWYCSGRTRKRDHHDYDMTAYEYGMNVIISFMVRIVE